MKQLSGLTVFLLAFLLAGTLLAGCGDEARKSSGSDYAFYVLPDSLAIGVGEERQFYAFTVSNGMINPVAASFSASGNVGSITEEGLFSAEAPGAGTVIAQYVLDVFTVPVTVEAAL